MKTVPNEKQSSEEQRNEKGLLNDVGGSRRGSRGGGAVGFQVRRGAEGGECSSGQPKKQSSCRHLPSQHAWTTDHDRLRFLGLMQLVKKGYESRNVTRLFHLLSHPS